jgi:hypothetical protein
LAFTGYPVNVFLDENGINKEITGKCTSDRKKGEQTMSDGKEFIAVLASRLKSKEQRLQVSLAINNRPKVAKRYPLVATKIKKKNI